MVGRRLRKLLSFCAFNFYAIPLRLGAEAANETVSGYFVRGGWADAGYCQRVVGLGSERVPFVVRGCLGDGMVWDALGALLFGGFRCEGLGV